MTNPVLTHPEEGVTNDADLVYEGRTRKRPPGASPTVRRIYTLLVTHSEGLTVSEIHDAMREDWTATDAYRAYEQHRKRTQSLNNLARHSPIPAYGTVVFQERARTWWIRSRLQGMKESRTAQREGIGKEVRWFAGERAPREMVECPVDVHLRPMNIHDAQRHADEHVRRERVKAELLAVLQMRGKKGQAKEGMRLAYEAVQMAYDYLSGR